MKLHNNRNFAITSLALASLLLGGCDSIRNTFGLDHYSPNEWDTAGPSPELRLPPNHNERPLLPPPTPGAPNPHAESHTDKVQKTVLGNVQRPQTAPSSGKSEKSVIEQASENQEITPDIRKKVDEEAQAQDTITEKVKAKIKEATKNLGNTSSEPSIADKQEKN